MTDHQRVAVVTGGNRGIGQATAVALAAGGFTVAVTARDPDTLADTLTAVEGTGGKAVPVGCDVRDETSVAAAAAEVDTLGPVHTVVANAGIAGPTRPLHQLSVEEWRDTVATDLDGVFLTFRAFLPGMTERAEGSLIAISSMTGKRPLHGRTPYAAAKMGVIGLIRTLAVELGPYRIRANSICPGAVSGPRIEDVIRKQASTRGLSEDEVRAEFASSSPLGRLVEASEVARACAFLASDAAASITGEDLNVTAGVVMY